LCPEGIILGTVMSTTESCSPWQGVLYLVLGGLGPYWGCNWYSVSLLCV
jgi:hypothetical protein